MPASKSCPHFNNRLNADFYDQRLDLVDLAYLSILAILPSLTRPLVSCAILPFSFLIYTYLQRVRWYKPPQPPADMAIVRIDGQRVYFNDGGYQEIEGWGHSGRGGSGRAHGRTCLICDGGESGKVCKRSWREWLWEMLERVVDLRSLMG